MEKILVVDDEIHVVRLLQEFLTSKGYEVYTAMNGAEALVKVKEMKPRIVLLDIMMPGMGGIDTLKEIKKIDPNIGVIMVTAIIDEDLANRAVKLGAYDYITKPINIDYLETCVAVKMIQILGERTGPPPRNSDSGRKDR
jgi:DNA-binding NtrC family response regulator